MSSPFDENEYESEGTIMSSGLHEEDAERDRLQEEERLQVGYVDGELTLDIAEEKFIEKELPLFMHRSGKPVQIGVAVVRKYKDRTLISGVLTDTDGQEMGSLITSGLVGGLSLGGFVDKDKLSKLN